MRLLAKFVRNFTYLCEEFTRNLSLRLLNFDIFISIPTKKDQNHVKFLTNFMSVLNHVPCLTIKRVIWIWAFDAVILNST